MKEKETLNESLLQSDIPPGLKPGLILRRLWHGYSHVFPKHPLLLRFQKANSTDSKKMRRRKRGNPRQHK
jgi:hypothetical protein